MPEEIKLNDKPETMEVELLSGLKVTLPKDQALKEIEQRQKYKTDLRSAHEELGRIKSEKDAAVESERAKATQAEAAAAVQAGQYEKANEIMQRESDARFGRLENNFRKSRLAELIGNASVVPEAVKDIADALSASCRVDPLSGSLAVVGADGKTRVGSDGKPLSVEALIAEYTDSRPHLRKATSTPGSGAAGGAGTKSGRTLLRSEFDALPTPAAKSAFFADGGTLRDS